MSYPMNKRRSYANFTHSLPHIVEEYKCKFGEAMILRDHGVYEENMDTLGYNQGLN